MSEPDSGSDLASIRTAATSCPGGWRGDRDQGYGPAHAPPSPLPGWPWLRTGERAADPATPGFSQLIIDLTAPGVQISPIEFLDGEQHFKRGGAGRRPFVPAADILGAEGRAAGGR